MRWTHIALLMLGVLAATLYPPTSLVAVGPGPTGIRLGVPQWNYTEPHWELRWNPFAVYLDAHGCTDDHPCALTAQVPIPIEHLVAADDDFEFFIAPAAGTVLVSVTAHCDLNCGTPATFTFEDRALNAIALTGGGALTAGTGTGNSTFVTFDTSDGDRILDAGEGVKFSVTNTPTTDQRVTLLLIYRYTPAYTAQ